MPILEGNGICIHHYADGGAGRLVDVAADVFNNVVNALILFYCETERRVAAL
jgi:hypothetical protein